MYSAKRLIVIQPPVLIGTWCAGALCLANTVILMEAVLITLWEGLSTRYVCSVGLYPHWRAERKSAMKNLSPFAGVTSSCLRSSNRPSMSIQPLPRTGYTHD